MLTREAWREGADAARPGAIDLGDALACLRASNMQVMRLQLAAERQDRRGVMAAIDELVGIDRELERLIGPVPEVAIQRHELLAERLVLARGKIGPAVAPAAAPAAEAEPLLLTEEVPAARQRWPWVLAALLLLAIAAAALWMFGGEMVARSWLEAL